jgi:hypothetical protein
MPQKRIHLIPAPCQRCGRQVYTASRSPLGLDTLKAKWGVLCETCVTPAENAQIVAEQAAALLGRRNEH